MNNNHCIIIIDIDYKSLMNLETAYETFTIAQQTGCSAPVLNRLLKSLPENVQYCIKLPHSVSSVFINHSKDIYFII